MDRLLNDIENHNRKLSEVLTAKNLDQVKQETHYLREDVKSLDRKSVGLTDQQRAQLNEIRDRVVRLTEALESTAGDSKFDQAQTSYKQLQSSINSIQGLVSGTSVAQKAAVNPEVERLMQDVRNHTQKLGEVVSDMNKSQIRQETAYLRQDVKALIRNESGLSQSVRDRLQEQEGAIAEITQEMDTNAEQGQTAALQAKYKLLQDRVNQVEALATGQAQTRQAAQTAQAIVSGEADMPGWRTTSKIITGRWDRRFRKSLCRP